MKLITLILVLLTLDTWAQNNIQGDVINSPVQGPGTRSVPDPGENGKKTLLGIDTDLDGVRDDIQIWINKTYPLNTFPSTNKALKQLTKYEQLVLLHHQNKDEVLLYEIKALEAINCLGWIRGDASRLMKQLRGEFLNTKARVVAYMQADSYFDGANRPKHIANTKYDDKKSFCEFDAVSE